MYDAKGGCLERFVDSVEASLVSGVQGLDRKKNCQSFVGLLRVKECIIGILGIQGIKRGCPNMVRISVTMEIQK